MTRIYNEKYFIDKLEELGTKKKIRLKDSSSKRIKFDVLLKNDFNEFFLKLI